MTEELQPVEVLPGQLGLFGSEDADLVLPAVELIQMQPGPKLGTDAKRTRRQARLLAEGLHPATGQPLHPDARPVRDPHQPVRCGTCAWLVGTSPAHTSTVYWKCDLLPITHGPATDVRRWWPGCVSWSGTSPARSPAPGAGPPPPEEGPDSPTPPVDPGSVP